MHQLAIRDPPAIHTIRNVHTGMYINVERLNGCSAEIIGEALLAMCVSAYSNHGVPTGDSMIGLA